MTNRETEVPHGGTAPTRALIRRMMRTRIALAPAEPAAWTPAQVMTAFFEERGIEVSASAVVDLSERLHEDGVFYFADDFAIHGSLISGTLTAIGEAIEAQADLIAKERWPERSRLRLLVRRYEQELAAVLGELGMT